MESVTRMRRMIQADRPDLRGQKWEERHRKAEAERLRQLGIPSVAEMTPRLNRIIDDALKGSPKQENNNAS